jgi:hypothetical protein
MCSLNFVVKNFEVQQNFISFLFRWNSGKQFRNFIKKHEREKNHVKKKNVRQFKTTFQHHQKIHFKMGNPVKMGGGGATVET